MIALSKRRGEFNIYANPGAVACLCGPLASRRKRMAVACACAARVLGFGADPRIIRLIEIGRRYANHVAQFGELEAALREADAVGGEARRLAGAPVWSIFEGLRAGEAAAGARSACIATGSVRWALGLPGGISPRVPLAWPTIRAVVAGAATPETCNRDWRTSDVLAMARLVRDEGETGILPILADALQDAGCADERILDHCREPGHHTSACWVPELILDMDDEL